MNIQNFPGQHALISSRLKDIIDEIDTNQSLMLRLRSHADSMALVLKSITFPEHFLNYFSYVNSVLCKYMSVMAENNCKLQAVLNEELLKRDFTYNEYENFINYRSKPLPLTAVDPRTEVYSFEFTNNLPQQPHLQNYAYIPAMTDVQSGENVGYTLAGNYGFVSNVPQNGGADQVREYYTQYVNNDLFPVQDVRYIPVTTAVENQEVSELSGYQGEEVLRQENINSYICYTENSQVRVLPVRRPRFLTDVGSQDLRQEKQYYRVEKDEEQYYRGVENEGQYYDEVKEGEYLEEGVQGYEEEDEEQGYEEVREEQDYGEEKEEGEYEEEKGEQGYEEEEGEQGYEEQEEEGSEKSDEHVIDSGIRSGKNENWFNLDIETLTTDSTLLEASCIPKIEAGQGCRRTSYKQYTAEVTHAVSPSEIYVRFVQEKCPLLQKLQRDLEALKTDEEYKRPFFFLHQKSKKLNKFRLKKLGNYGLFYSAKENSFFRVQFLDTDLDAADNLVSVFLLDTGLEERVSLQSIYPMPEKLKKYPRFAFKCHLTDISPMDSLYTVHWSSYDIELMKEWISKNDRVLLVIDEDARENGKTLPILLYDLEKVNCLNNLMRDIQAVKGEKSDKLYKFILDNWDPMLDAHESNMNTYDLDVDDPSCAIYGYVAKDYERLCKHYRKTGKCFKGVGCRKEHGLLNSSGFTTDREEIFVDAFKSLRIPALGEELEVEVTHVANGSQFYCNEFINPNKRKETLASLVNYMNEKSNLLKMKKISIPPSVGQIVIAKYTGDNFWYRAKLLDVIPENDEYTVFFVDYGNEETLPLSHLRMIRPEFLHFPFQSMFCEIQGVVSSADTLHESIKYLDEVCSSVVKIKVVSVLPGFTPHLVVRLYTEEGEDIAKNMVDKNLVLSEEKMILDDTQIIPG